MRLSLLIAAAGLAVLAFAGLSGLSKDTPRPAHAQDTTTIEVGDFWFCNSSFQGAVCQTNANVGDTVEWKWVGNISHTSTECAGDLDTCPSPHLWDSGTKSSGSFSFTFDTPGTYVYRCQIHTSLMRGQITVQAAATPTPPPSPSPTAGASPSPAAASPTATPGAAPSSGGPPEEGAAFPWWLLLTTGGGLLLTAAALGARAARRSQARL